MKEYDDKEDEHNNEELVKVLVEILSGDTIQMRRYIRCPYPKYENGF